MFKESFIEKVTSSETLKKNGDPEAGACLANSRNVTDVCVARGERGRIKVIEN